MRTLLASVAAGALALAAGAFPALAGAADNRSPLYPYSSYSGEGRYTMEKGDRAKRVQNLAAVASRFGEKPYATLWDAAARDGLGSWQSERLVFHDVTTGARIVRLTNDYGSDYVDYHRGAWNADGSRVLFRRKPGMWESSTDTNGPTCVTSDGRFICPVFRGAPGSKLVRKYQCDRFDPRVAYSMVGDKTLCAFDLVTGKYLRTLAETGGSWHLKMSYDGRNLLSYFNDNGNRMIWVVPTDSKDGDKMQKVTVSKAIHDSYLAHPTEPYVIFWYEDGYRQEGFRQKKFDNTDEQATGVQFDWNHGDFGPDRGVHETGRIFPFKGLKWEQPVPMYVHTPGEEYYDDPHDYNGYTSWQPKDEPWTVGSRLVWQPFISELQMHGVSPVENDPVNRFRLCLIGLQRGGCLDAVDGSPDGTKFLFNSDVFDQNQAFYVVARNPEPPRVEPRVSFENDGSVVGWPVKCTLTWKPAKHSKETRGYIVYRSNKSGGPYEQISDIVEGATFVDESPPRKDNFYVVTAVEHAGLESGYSVEAAAAPRSGAPNIFAEAERGEWNTAVWKCFHGSASDLYYVWMRKKGAEGKVAVPVNLTRSGSYALWARVKGGGSWTVSGEKLDASGDEWKWVKAPKPLDLKAGEQKLEFSTGDFGAALDCIWLVCDDGFKPTGMNALDTTAPAKPSGLKAEASGPFAAKLAWQPSAEKDLAYYSVYVSDKADFACARETLLASPIDPAYLDWQLRPNMTYHYRVTAVDRRGNESEPSDAATVETAKLDIEKVEANMEAGKPVTVKIERGGKYRLWLRVDGAGRGYVNFELAGKKATWTLDHSEKVSPSSWFSYGQFATFDVPAGEQTVTVTTQNDTKLGRLVLTNDLSWRPEGHISTACAW